MRIKSRTEKGTRQRMGFLAFPANNAGHLLTSPEALSAWSVWGSRISVTDLHTGHGRVQLARTLPPALGGSQSNLGEQGTRFTFRALKAFRDRWMKSEHIREIDLGDSNDQIRAYSL